jgi:hypothetical protein
MTSDLNTLVNRYIDAWNETDAGRRRELVAGTWSEDGTYVAWTSEPSPRTAACAR